MKELIRKNILNMNFLKWIKLIKLLIIFIIIQGKSK